MLESQSNLIEAIANAVLAATSTEVLLQILEDRGHGFGLTPEKAISYLAEYSESIHIESESTDDDRIAVLHYLVNTTSNKKINEFFQELIDNGTFDVPENVINDAVNEWIDNNRPPKSH